jgi:hypothetical protein
MRLLAVCALTLSLFLCGAYAAFAHPWMHGLRIAHQSFSATDVDVQETVGHEIDSLDKVAFAGHLSPGDDRTALNEFISTIAQQARAEKWQSFAIEVWVGGRSAPAGYYVRYSATEPGGVPVEGGGLIATDKSAAKSIAIDVEQVRVPE